MRHNGLNVPLDVALNVEAISRDHLSRKGAHPPTHPHAGSDAKRASVGLPGHCEPCAVVGHVVAHPDHGCGDVGCNVEH